MKRRRERPDKARKNRITHDSRKEGRKEVINSDEARKRRTGPDKAWML